MRNQGNAHRAVKMPSAILSGFAKLKLVVVSGLNVGKRGVQKWLSFPRYRGGAGRQLYIAAVPENQKSFSWPHTTGPHCWCISWRVLLKRIWPLQSHPWKIGLPGMGESSPKGRNQEWGGGGGKADLLWCLLAPLEVWAWWCMCFAFLNPSVSAA